MTDVLQIKDDMEVVGSDGQHVGTVDGVENETIKLAKNDSVDGAHHFLPLSCVGSVDRGKVRLNRCADDVKAAWAGPDAELYLDKRAEPVVPEGTKASI
jgi:hypothetical protein